MDKLNEESLKIYLMHSSPLISSMASELLSLRTEIAELREKSGECVWKIDGDEWDAETYDTTCGNKYVIINGMPADNNMKFCVYCGKKLATTNNNIVGEL